MSKAGPLTRSRSRRAKASVPPKDMSDMADVLHGPSLHTRTPQRQWDTDHAVHTDEIVIGLALGSPGQSPLPLLPPDDRDVGLSRGVDISYTCTSPGLGNACQIGAEGDGLKRKGSKWKKFGSLFGRKEPLTQIQAPAPFYQLDRVLEREPTEQHNNQDRLDFNALRRKRADSSRSNKTRTDSSQSTNKEHDRLLLKRNISKRKGLRRRKIDEFTPKLLQDHDVIAIRAEIEGGQPNSQAPQQAITSLLQIEIPSVALERYSVMFGDQLQNQSQPEDVGASMRAPRDSQSSASSRLKSSHVRDVSPSSKSTRSASFSLFPSSGRPPATHTASSCNKPTLHPSPLSRSVTTPTSTFVSSRPEILQSKSQDQSQSQALVIVHDTENVTSPLSSHAPKLSSNLSYLSTSSTQNSFFECSEYPSSKQITSDRDTEPSAIQGPKDISPQRPFPARKSSMKKLPLPPDVSKPSKDPRSDLMTTANAAEVSIARQISISRRQRQLLVPIAPKLARQPMQPTSVNGISTPAARKSHHLTLEEDMDKKIIE